MLQPSAQLVTAANPDRRRDERRADARADGDRLLLERECDQCAEPGAPERRHPAQPGHRRHRPSARDGEHGADRRRHGVFDSKYTYLLWRPITAIRNADIDGNPATTADPTWTPLVTTPNHPEYPSQHGCVTSAFAQVLAYALGTSQINATIPGAEGGATTLTTSQTFATVHDLDTQLVDARVWIGFHYRNSVIVGENLGTAVAHWELRRYFLPTDDDDESVATSARHARNQTSPVTVS